MTLKSLNGVWVLEIAGIYGWERIATVFLENGRYLGGGAFHYTQGSYVLDGKKVKFKLHLTQHGEKRTIFGEKSHHIYTEMIAKCKTNKIQGKARLKSAKSTAAEYPFQLLRQTDIVPV